MTDVSPLKLVGEMVKNIVLKIGNYIVTSGPWRENVLMMKTEVVENPVSCWLFTLFSSSNFTEKLKASAGFELGSSE